MSQNINIQELVNEITQPNAVCVIDNEVPENPEKRHLHLIYSLVNIVKQCIQKEMYHPYIHIKDIQGNFLFNDRLHIEDANINQTAINNPGYCDIHLIMQKDTSKIYYCATTPDTLADNNRYYIDQVNFTNGTIDTIAYKKAAFAILDMIKKGEKLDLNQSIDTSVTVHNYEPNSKHWSIEYYQINCW
ncbi:hypothetical protein [uncultured Aquimarina sp.]|uniref:hypothetical protein n=1 Tax=uncultured Aquimarina sp. TaxID=575652 RepID=UPI0026151CDE|nr:hypothetical protein [uncultured Aquimarina sp.]